MDNPLSEIMDEIRDKIPDVKVEIEQTGDPRNYEVSFGKMSGIGLFPVRTLESGVSELIRKYRGLCAQIEGNRNAT